MSAPVLRMERVGISVPMGGRAVPVLEDFSLSVTAGEFAALVGESGSGKSLAVLSVPRLLPAGAVVGGEIWLGGEQVSAWPEAALRAVRGKRVGMVFQDSLAALNPLMRVGAHIAEPLMRHGGLGRRAAWARAVELLAEVGIAEPAVRAGLYPHEFSGGMRQRVMIASALAGDPELLIADEPVSGLDAVTAANIMALLARLRRARGLAVLLVAHDLGLVRRHADSITVLYAGRIAERGPARALLGAPAHPYSMALLRAAPVLGRAPAGIEGQMPEPAARGPGCAFAPRCHAAAASCAELRPALPVGAGAACFFPSTPLPAAVGAVTAAVVPGAPVLRVERLSVRYGTGWWRRRAGVAALQGVDFTLAAGECLAVIGASGSGKSTLGRAVLGLVAFEGAVRFGAAAEGAPEAALAVGAVFQDPASSLNPGMTVAAVIAEAISLSGARGVTPADMLAAVGLPAALLGRRAASLSGGQAQRVAIARALAGNPALLVLDEPTASLDVSSQATILTLLRDLAASRGLAMILITHDLAAVSFMAHRVAVLDRGRLVDMQAIGAFLKRG